MNKIFISGIAGFIGFHLYKKLKDTNTVNGIDILNSKASEIRSKSIKFNKISLLDSNFTFGENIPDIAIHLAAETGISGSLINPSKYLENNVQATFNLLEQCRKNKVKYFIYASSSSVYETNQNIMYEDSKVNKQLSFYGTTKRMTEIMVENYCRQFGITAIGLRFFTVYGSWTRPDMAAYKFMKAINDNKTITLYNNGNVSRDFTHISDIVNSLELLVSKIMTEKQGFHEIFNIGNGKPISVKKYAELIAENLGKEFVYENRELPKNEAKSTFASNKKLQEYINYKPKTTIEYGIKEMVNWFKNNKY